MTRRRWIADEVSGNRAAITGDHARHLAQVLRAQVGQEFDISTGSEVRRGKVTAIRPDRVEFELSEAVAQSKQTEITVAISILKFDRMEWAIEKCVELGVARIIPVIAGRTEKHLAAAATRRVERWRRIVQQSSEQSRRSSIAAGDRNSSHRAVRKEDGHRRHAERSIAGPRVRRGHAGVDDRRVRRLCEPRPGASSDSDSTRRGR